MSSLPKLYSNKYLKQYFLKKGSRSVGQKNADSLAIQLSRVVSGYAINVRREDRLDNYTYYVPAENPLEIINLVITADGDSLLEGSIFTYQMTPDFAQDLNQFTTDFRFFTGALTVSPLARLADVYYRGIQKNGEDDGTDCLEWIFSQRPDRPNGGGGGSDGNDSGPTVSTGSGPVGGTYGGLCVQLVSVPCSCHPAHEPGEHCACGTGNDSNPDHHQPYEVITFVRCDEENGDQLTDATYGSENKTLDPEDCPELLSSIGVVARELNYPQAGSRLTEAVESAVSETCFSLPAVMHIIDLDAFANCISGGVASGPDCVVRQIEAYLNGLGIINQDPGSGPTINSFSGLPHDQLAAFLNAAVAGEGNEHVYNAISNALQLRSLSIIYENLPLRIIQLSKISLQSSSLTDFQVRVASFIELIERSNPEEINESHIAWMADNSDDVSLLLNFNDSNPDFDVDYYVDMMTSYGDEVNLSRMLDSHIDWSSLKDFDTPILEFDNYVSLGTPSVYNGDLNSFQKIAVIPTRAGYDETDMCTNCWDHAIQYINGFNAPEENHWMAMRDLFEITTMGTLDEVGEDFIARFELNLGGEFHHADLTRAAMEHESTKNSLRYFGDWLSARLRVANGDVDFPTQNLNSNFRPKFPDSKLSGLTILVNDTYKTDFRLIDIQTNQQDRTWSAVIGVEIHDHFGVDFEDALDTQHIHTGFSSWFQLQHQFNHQPFVSVMKFTIPVEGTY